MAVGFVDFDRTSSGVCCMFKQRLKISEFSFIVIIMMIQNAYLGVLQ